jgi:hypothetical protein
LCHINRNRISLARSSSLSFTSDFSPQKTKKLSPKQNLEHAIPRSHIQHIVHMSNCCVTSEPKFIQYLVSSGAVDHQGVASFASECSALCPTSSFFCVTFHAQMRSPQRLKRSYSESCRKNFGFVVSFAESRGRMHLSERGFPVVLRVI